MRTAILFSVSLLFSISAFAQVPLKGKVIDQKGRKVAGASVAIVDSYDGATTDSAGAFQFTTTEAGVRTILVTMIGYRSVEQSVDLSASLSPLEIVLREEINELKAVTITAGSFEASDTKRTTVLNPIDIVTTASANADVTGAVRTLPGAQQVGENEGLFVRGGTAQETKIFIDGTLVNNFFFSSVPDLAQRGRFSPFLFKGTIFSSGGYSALYGDALSSALILESIDFPEQSSGNLGISTVGLSAGYQKLSRDKKFSWGASYNYTNLIAYFALVKQRPDNFRLPEFHNGDLNFRVKTSKTGILKFYGYFNQSTLGVRRPDIDSPALKNAFGLTNANIYANLAWRERIGKHWKLNLGSSFSTNTDQISNQLQDSQNKAVSITEDPYQLKAFELRSRGDLATIKAVLERRLSGITAVRFGGEYLKFRNSNQFTNKEVDGVRTQADDDYKAAFAESDIYFTNHLAAKIGGRLEHSSLLGRSNVAPRVSLAYRTGQQGQVSLAYGMFYQRPDRDFYLQNFAYNSLEYTKATHYIANYQRMSRDYTLRAEVFYKKYHNLVKTHMSSSGRTDSLSNAGFGDAAGFELFWRDRKSIKSFDYWISYSYLDTRRDFLNYPGAIQPSFAANHTANLVMKKFVTKMKTQFNATYTFATGRPYYNIRLDENTGRSYIADQGRTIPFHSMSFSVNYLPSLGNASASRFTVFVFSINNVLGSDQVFGYNYSANGMRRDPIVPAARRFFFLGCFLSFGVDRSDDIINSNL